jgi:hypothetical protein
MKARPLRQLQHLEKLSRHMVARSTSGRLESILCCTVKMGWAITPITIKENNVFALSWSILSSETLDEWSFDRLKGAGTSAWQQTDQIVHVAR